VRLGKLSKEYRHVPKDDPKEQEWNRTETGLYVPKGGDHDLPSASSHASLTGGERKYSRAQAYAAVVGVILGIPVLIVSLLAFVSQLDTIETAAEREAALTEEARQADARLVTWWDTRQDSTTLIHVRNSSGIPTGRLVVYSMLYGKGEPKAEYQFKVEFGSIEPCTELSVEWNDDYMEAYVATGFDLAADKAPGKRDISKLRRYEIPWYTEYIEYSDAKDKWRVEPNGSVKPAGPPDEPSPISFRRPFPIMMIAGLQALDIYPGEVVLKESPTCSAPGR